MKFRFLSLIVVIFISILHLNYSYKSLPVKEHVYKPIRFQLLNLAYFFTSIKKMDSIHIRSIKFFDDSMFVYGKNLDKKKFILNIGKFLKIVKLEFKNKGNFIIQCKKKFSIF